MLKIKKQIFNSILVSADSKKELAETMMRFQEYYESPVWQGKIFTRGQFLNWYSTEYGANTYAADWSGFNFPSIILEPFKKGLFDPLTNNEKKLIKLLRYRNDDFYIIGANSSDVLKHELCHALYYTNKEYRSEVEGLLNKNKNKIKHLIKHLLEMGYCEGVLLDEVQAYVLDGTYLQENNIEVPEEIINNIKKIYKRCAMMTPTARLAGG